MFDKVDFGLYQVGCFGVIQVGNDRGQIFPPMTPIIGHLLGRIAKVRSVCPSDG